MKNKTVAVGMSGGIDSSLAAGILKTEGYTVIGITMAIYSGDAEAVEPSCHACYGPGEQEDIKMAQEVAEFLGIPHYTIDLKEEYRKTVLNYFTSEYLSGRTPNPCVRCNPLLKFGLMIEKAHNEGLSFDLFSTGHYVRNNYDPKRERYVLKKGLDQKKDQSYFLYALEPDLLPNLLFPLGSLTKAEVRSRVRDLKLPVSEQPESQDFIEGGNYSSLFPADTIIPGPIMDIDGRTIGTHKGIINYTIGQRRGIGIAHKEPLYVLRIDAAENTIVVGPRNNLFSDTLLAKDLNFLCGGLPGEPLRIKAKIRYNHEACDSQLVPLDDGRVRVVFDVPQLSITPGQAVVFYDGDVVMGGGIIC